MFRHKFNQKEQDELLKKIVIMVDTREQVNQHITDYFDSKKIKWESTKLDYGDYSFRVDVDNLGWCFDRSVAIERKANLDELANNLSHERDRFVNELMRAYRHNTRLYLLVEQGNWRDIELHKYISKLSAQSYFASLKAFEDRYNVHIVFEPMESGKFIYSTMYYKLKNYLKGE